MYDDFESGAWHDKKKYYPQFREKQTNDFDTSDKTKTLKQNPSSLLPRPPTNPREAPPRFHDDWLIDKLIHAMRHFSS
jgi:hypothetical protein